MANPRTHTIVGELDKAVKEFALAKEVYVSAQAEYEAARERFISMRRLASEALSAQEWSKWEEHHDDVKFVGMEIGEAVARVLETHAYQSAFEHLGSPKEKRYGPEMYVDRIVDALESGGSEFGSSTPRRVINAALINKQKTVTRLGHGLYRIANAPAILDEVRKFKEDYPDPPKEPTARIAEAAPRFDPGDELDPAVENSLARDIEADPEDAPF